jgi:transposase
VAGPAPPGPWRSAFSAFRRWTRRGVWQQLLAKLAGERDRSARIIDSSIVRARQHAAGPRSGSEQALGRSRGLIGAADQLHQAPLRRRRPGRPVDPRPTGGQGGDCVPALDLLNGKFAPVIIADEGYGSDRVLAFIEGQASQSVIPPRSRWPRREFDRGPYRSRHRVGFCFNRLEQHRRIAARYEKLAAHYLRTAPLASALVWSEV